MSEMTKPQKKKTFLSPGGWATVSHGLPAVACHLPSAALREAKPSILVCWPPDSFRGRQVLPVLRFNPRREQTMRTLDAGCGLSATSLLACCTLDSHPSAKALSPTERREERLSGLPPICQGCHSGSSRCVGAQAKGLGSLTKLFFNFSIRVDRIDNDRN